MGNIRLSFSALTGMLPVVTAVLCMAAVVVSCVHEGHPEGASLGPGDRLPDFRVTLSDGTSVSTEDLEGHVSLIAFFNTGCPDCREELPVLQAVYEEFADDIVLLCISREEGAASVASYWEEHSLTMPWSAQDDRRVYSLFAASGIPRIYIAAPDLTISAVNSVSPLASLDRLRNEILQNF